MSVVLSSTKPRARKEHRCDECDRGIAVGETYYRVNTVSDDWGLGSWVACEHCHRLCRDLFAADVVGEDEMGNEVYPYLREVDWPDVELMGQPWPERRRWWLAQWSDGHALVAYPEVPS